MQYHLQEATFDLPEGSFIDRSVNVLVFGDPALPFSVVITRDYFDEGGSVEQLLREQVKALATSGKQFRELEFGTTYLPLNAPPGAPSSGGAHNAAGAYVTYTKQGHPIHQKVVLAEMPGRRALVVTGTHAGPWKDVHLAHWASVLHSLRLRA
ncbi:DUF1795 domain-containing protein [Acidovorax sp. NCPPB 4044]|uniref:DUF1795 domain-containing protein n=1 Tax=Acidovorax sp. NCPPB 4044 TaxID=2940490 RepID=UPI002302CFEC|nr:DUF1795 domain-containing protein [Acidovorax sp. NCPPB 4044]MDA8519511.1 DUF1795 domain-containing protein [Acidovorax sp. NCPPB 4044]